MKMKFGIVALGLLASVATLFSCASENKQENTDTSSETTVQTVALDGTHLTGLKDLEGNTVDMDPNKVVFLNVWATWCGPCNIEMPGIQSLYGKFKDNEKVQFFIVSDEDASIVNPFIARKGYALPFFQYENQFPTRLDGNAIPRTYIIHKGQVIREGIGAEQWDTEEIVSLITNAANEI